MGAAKSKWKQYHANGKVLAKSFSLREARHPLAPRIHLGVQSIEWREPKEGVWREALLFLSTFLSFLFSQILAASVFRPLVPL